MNSNSICRKSTSVFLIAALGLHVLLSIMWTVATNDLTMGLLLAALVTIPAAILGWFVLSLVLYLRSKRRQDEDVQQLKSRLIVAIVLLIFLAGIIAALIGFFAMAIAHM